MVLEGIRPLANAYFELAAHQTHCVISEEILINKAVGKTCLASTQSLFILTFMIHVMSQYRLTEEGIKYLKTGLPERQMIELLSKIGETEIGIVQKELGEIFNIALQWCKKLNVVEIKNGKMSLTSNKIPDEIHNLEKSLNEVLDGKEPVSSDAQTLVRRNLIEEEKETLEKKAEKIIGNEITYLLPEVIASDMWKKKPFRKYNVTVPGSKMDIGKRQPYSRFLSRFKQRLVELGFIEMTGPMIETEFWNFDALFQPQNHPARDWTDTYQLKDPSEGDLPDKKIVAAVSKEHEKGWKYKWSPEKAAKLMPRAHGTAISARTLINAEIPGKYFSVSRCFRPDVFDATHLIEFNQIEGIVLDKSLTFRNLLGLLKMFAKEVAGAEKMKFLTDYYPFTEPSVQMSALHPKLGWVEFGGAGIFREELTKPLGINVPVIAWGLGIDRLAMFKLGINDMRQLFSQDIEWLRNAKVK